MFEFVAGVLALGLAAQIVFWIVVGLLFPLFWLWMLVDAALRRDDEYPSMGGNEKLVWIVLMAFFQIACAFYFFMVYRKIERGTLAAPAAVSAPAVTSTGAPAGM